MVNNKKCAAIVLAAGSGRRMNMNITKQTITILGKSVLRHTLDAVIKAPSVTSVVIVCRADEVDFARSQCDGCGKDIKIVVGGRCRAESAKIGFEQVPHDTDAVIIHDGARCLVTPSDIEKVVDSVYKYGAATASSRVTDTVKKCDRSGVIKETVNREDLRCVQTPQGFTYDIYRRALDAANEINADITDDNMLVEGIGVEIRSVDTSPMNIKITTECDLTLAEYILSKRKGDLI